MQTFLSHLKDIASSPLAYVGYLVALVAWVVRTWMIQAPRRQAREILDTFGSDKLKISALRNLLGEDPPAGLPAKQLLDWVRIKTQEKAYGYVAVAYISTLVTGLAIVGLAAYAYVTKPDATGKQGPPQLIQEHPNRG